MDQQETKPPKTYSEPHGIKSWAEEDRPREKLLLKGKQVLSESELIAILVRTGTENNDALQVAKDLLARVKNDLNELSKLSVKDMLALKVKGIGQTKAITIVAALELGRRRQSAETKEKEKISSSRDAFDMMHPVLADKTSEEFWILLLNRANRVTEKINISTGGLTGTVADTRIIFNHAIKAQATSIILIHNHPSGNLNPSQADIELTKKLAQAGKVLDVAVLDHLIIGGNGFYSFADEGMM